MVLLYICVVYLFGDCDCSIIGEQRFSQLLHVNDTGGRCRLSCRGRSHGILTPLSCTTVYLPPVVIVQEGFHLFKCFAEDRDIHVEVPYKGEAEHDKCTPNHYPGQVFGVFPYCFHKMCCDKCTPMQPLSRSGVRCLSVMLS